ncbi:MAG: 1,2-oxophytodienoate reductase [Streptosporangiaceae bacterium]|nr:1,2-oxophytodienoate reductase [Streptosporangiaceae bacterium]
MTPLPSASAAGSLFLPFSAGRLNLPNRIVMAPMTREFSPNGIPGADVAEYYTRRAAGGVGLIITEGTYIDHPSAGTSRRVPFFHGEEALAGWGGVVEAVHAAGGRIAPQLWHVGAARAVGAPPFPDAPPVGPSGLALDGTPFGEAMSSADVDDVVNAFADAAAAAERLGFDAIELHGAHGYLIDQFFWSGTNRRADAYGGDLVSRTRFAADIIAAVRTAVSPGFPIIFRLSQWKMGSYQAKMAESPQELESLLTPLVEAGADVLHASTRRYWLPEFEGSDLNLAGWAKKLTGLPAITVGSVGLDNEFINAFKGENSEITSIDRLLERLQRDEFDLVAVGRSLIADPGWAAKIRDGRADQVIGFDTEMLKSLR